MVRLLMMRPSLPEIKLHVQFDCYPKANGNHILVHSDGNVD